MADPLRIGNVLVKGLVNGKGGLAAETKEFSARCLFWTSS